MGRYFRGSYLFWVLIAVFVARNFMGMNSVEDFKTFIIETLILLPGIIIGLTCHEFGHAKMANVFGDPTPKDDGRLTLNPLAHIDPIGFVCIIFGGIGWAKPVRVNPSYFKNFRRDDLIVDFAGVACNFIVAVVFIIICKAYIIFSSAIPPDVNAIIYAILIQAVQINFLLMVFNLLPIPPLDGFGILTNLFDLRRYRWWGTIYQYGGLILIVVILSGRLGTFLYPPINALMDITYRILL